MQEFLLYLYNSGVFSKASRELECMLRRIQGEVNNPAIPQEKIRQTKLVESDQEPRQQRNLGNKVAIFLVRKR